MKNADHLRAEKSSSVEILNLPLKLRDNSLHNKVQKRQHTCASLPEQGKGFGAATGDERHLDALPPDLVPVQTADGAYGLSQAEHLDGGLQLIVSMGAQLHSFHLGKSY